MKCRRSHTFLQIAARYCRIIALRASALFSLEKCSIDLVEVIVNLVYASYRRSDLPLLITFRQMVFKKLNTPTNPFLTLPATHEQFDVGTSRVTAQVSLIYNLFDFITVCLNDHLLIVWLSNILLVYCLSNICLIFKLFCLSNILLKWSSQFNIQIGSMSLMLCSLTNNIT
jgi:hypothetical protein